LPVINGSYECPCCGEKSEEGKQDVQEAVGGHHCSNVVQYQVLWVVSYFEASSKAERKPYRVLYVSVNECLELPVERRLKFLRNLTGS